MGPALAATDPNSPQDMSKLAYRQEHPWPMDGPRGTTASQGRPWGLLSGEWGLGQTRARCGRGVAGDSRPPETPTERKVKQAAGSDRRAVSGAKISGVRHRSPGREATLQPRD